MEGEVEGKVLGEVDGSLLGDIEGEVESCVLGLLLGLIEGKIVGGVEGTLVGGRLGNVDGEDLGANVPFKAYTRTCLASWPLPLLRRAPMANTLPPLDMDTAYPDSSSLISPLIIAPC